MLILNQCDCILLFFFHDEDTPDCSWTQLQPIAWKTPTIIVGGGDGGGRGVSLLYSITQAHLNFTNNSNQSAVWCSRTRWNSRTKDHIQTPPVVWRKEPVWHKMSERNNKQNRGVFQRHSDEIATEESPWLPTFPLWLPASNTEDGKRSKLPHHNNRYNKYCCVPRWVGGGTRGGEKGCHKGRKRTWIRVDWWFGASLGTVSANPAVLVGKRKKSILPNMISEKGRLYHKPVVYLDVFISSFQNIFGSTFARWGGKKTRNPCLDASNRRNATFRVRLILPTSQEAKNGSLLVGKTLMAHKETSVIHVIMDNTIGPTC